MNSNTTSNKRILRAVLCVLSAVILLSAGFGLGYLTRPSEEPITQTEPTGYAANSAYEYLVGATAWQMSAEAHALMMQGFHVAQSNVNDMVAMAKELAPRSYFVHLRQIQLTGTHDFCECGHRTDAGSLDMYGIVRALVESGFEGYVRPDHGRNIWGEDGKPGYGLYDRALGATYLYGLFEAIEKEMARK